VAGSEHSSSTHAASARTDQEIRDIRLADDRMLMDWVRTGLSMISFGFTIYKVLEGLKESPRDVLTHPLAQQFSPRNVGLFLCGVGTLSIVMGAFEYAKSLRELGLSIATHIWRPAFILALLLSTAGVFVTVSMLSKFL
jgi:putative membrane protein